MISNKAHKTIVYSLIAFYSFFVFSKMSTPAAGLTRIGFNVYEILLIPGLLFFYKPLFQYLNSRLFIKNFYKFVLIFVFLLFFCLFGCINSSEYYLTHLRFYRVFFLSAVIFFYFSTTNHIDLFALFIICFASQCGDFLYILFFESHEDQVLNNTISFAILTSLCIFCRYNSISSLVLLFLGIIAFRTSYRAVILLYGITIISSFLISSFFHEKKKWILFILFVYLSCAFVINYNTIMEIFVSAFDLSYGTEQRITTRVTSLFSGDLDTSNDNIRLEVKNIIYDNLSEYFPSGLYRPALGQTGNYTDIPIIFLIDSFGSIAAVFILFIIFLRFVYFAWLFFISRPKSLVSALVLSQFPGLVFLFYFNGTFIYWHYTAVFTFMILGLLFNPNIVLIRPQRGNHFYIEDKQIAN